MKLFRIVFDCIAILIVLVSPCFIGRAMIRLHEGIFEMEE